MQPQEFWRNQAGYLWKLIEPAPLGTPNQDPPGWGVGAIIRDIPDADAPGTIDISEGDRVIQHWDPGWERGTGLELQCQMIAPSRDYYLARQRDTAQRKTDAETALAEAQDEVDRVDTMERDATTVAAVKVLARPEGDDDPDTGAAAKTPYEKRADARAVVAQINSFLPSADAALADVADVIDAVDSLARDFIPIPELQAEKDRLAAER